MGRRRRAAVAAPVMAALVAAGCTPRDASPEKAVPQRTLTAEFPPDTAPPAPEAGHPSVTTSPPASVPATTTTKPAAAPTTRPAAETSAAGPPPAPATAAEAPSSASISDPAGDVTLSPLDPPPAWADLLGARLTRSSAGYELRVRLAGGEAPARTPDDTHTMNIASFYDLDGDGHVDVEAWANVAERGWGSAHFDNTTGGGGYQERSGIQVTPEGDEVVLRFPLSHLRGAARFRWSVASEWGRYESLGSPTTARDAMPDNGAPAAFPG